MEIPKDAVAFLKEIYQNPNVALGVRMKAAIEAAPYECPRLAVTAHFEGQNFGELLEARLKRLADAGPKTIEATVEAPPAPLPPPSVPDRRFRRA